MSSHEQPLLPPFEEPQLPIEPESAAELWRETDKRFNLIMEIDRRLADPVAVRGASNIEEMEAAKCQLEAEIAEFYEIADKHGWLHEGAPEGNYEEVLV